MANKQLWMFDDFPEPNPAPAAGREATFGDYAGFVEKFKGKYTTDDCYTPDGVMDVVNDYARQLLPAKRRDAVFVRPFYPGGDFERYDYPEGCVVVDNPPFSIYAKIVRWYEAHNIDYFLFAPMLTCAVRGVKATYIIPNHSITYDNGAKVNTAFVTSLCRGTGVVCDSVLQERLRAVNYGLRKLARYAYDPHLASMALMQRYVRAKGLTIPADEMEIVSNFDALKAIDRSVFGAGVIVSSRVAAIIQPLYTPAVTGDEIPIDPSPREWEIIKRLDKKFPK